MWLAVRTDEEIVGEGAEGIQTCDAYRPGIE